MENDEMVSITIRLSNNEAMKFKEGAKEKELSQREYLVELMNESGVPQNRINNKLNCISIMLIKKNLFCKDERQNLTSKKIKIKGKPLYYPQFALIHPIKEYKDELKKEFQIDDTLQNYSFSQVLNLFKVEDNDECDYLVNEVIILKSRITNKIALHVSRCLYVKDFNEVQKNFYKYTDSNNLLEIELLMAREVKGGNSELKKFF